VTFEFTVRLRTMKSPARFTTAGLASESVTSLVESGTPSGFQFAASPQFDVLAPPSQVTASDPALATTK